LNISLFIPAPTENSEIRNGRLWKQIISFTGLHKGNVSYLPSGSSAIMFIGPELVLDTFYWSCITDKVYGLILDHNNLRYISLGSGKLNPVVITKTHPRSILVFIKAIGLG
jgi:hypothetical protein